MRSLSFVAVALFAAAMVVSSGCSEPTATAPAADKAEPAAQAETAVHTPETTTEGELTKVSFNVTGMS
jgi:hypothetical protein